MLVLTALTSGSNADLVAGALHLFVPPRTTVLDMTYGTGGFWRADVRDRYPVIGIDATRPATLQADFEHLPFRPGAFGCVVFDPPYANNGGAHKDRTKAGVARTYNLQPGTSTKVIHRLYRNGIAEAARVLRGQGYLMVKCQNGVESGQRQWTAEYIHEVARRHGLRKVEELVYVQSHIPMVRHNPDIVPQQHARVNHSYLLVFRRPGYVGQPALL